MFGGERIATLHARKQALILESALNRLTLRNDWQNVRSAAAWAGQAVETGRKLRPWLLLLAPLAGFLAVRSLRRPSPAPSRLMTLLKLIQPLSLLWASFARPTRESDPPAGP
jgi:hypothetical protein